MYVHDRSRWIHLRKINVSGKSCRENQFTHFMFNNFFPPKKFCHLWDNVEKYCRAGQATDDKIVHALCTLDNYGYRHTFRICNTYCFSSAMMVTGSRFIALFTCTLPVLLYFVIVTYSTYSNMSFALLCYVATIICLPYILQLHIYCPVWCLSVSTIECVMFYHHLHILQSYIVYMSISLCYFISIISLNDVRQVPLAVNRWHNDIITS